MIFKITNKLMSMWQAMSEREQRLGKITAAVVSAMLVITIYQRAVARIDDLDDRILRLEDDLVSYTYQIAHRELVESRYAEIAAQHSSAWTEAEIHDRLRQEIYRLARRTPPPLDDNGIPVNTPDTDGNLVEIPALGKGNMAEGGQGYREYMLNLRIPPTELQNIVHFLERLQQSPQALRVDALDLSRAPDGVLVGASIDITRVVADGVQTVAPSTAAASSGMGRITLNAASWQGAGAHIEDAPAQGAHGAVAMRAGREEAEAYMVRSLPGGSVYEMIIDIAAAPDAVVLGVGLDDNAVMFEGAQETPGDGGGHRYHVQFTLPGKSDAQLRIRCPWILMPRPDTEVQISNLLLRQVVETS